MATLRGSQYTLWCSVLSDSHKSVVLLLTYGVLMRRVALGAF